VWYDYIRGFSALETSLPPDKWLDLDDAVRQMKNMVNEAAVRMEKRDFVQLKYRKAHTVPAVDDVNEIALMPKDMPKYAFIAAWTSAAEKFLLLNWIFEGAPDKQKRLTNTVDTLKEMIEDAGNIRQTKLRSPEAPPAGRPIQRSLP
jgi:hypothetical protein